MTQEYLANKAGLSLRDLKRIEECQPSYTATLRLVDTFAKVLEVKPEELLKRVVLLKS
jgi:transcriptional regulator with XRE-family HTH domain